MTNDIVGVEVGGALKNVFALAGIFRNFSEISNLQQPEF
jgi:glycerol-3-phosphate dehydrogenase